MCRCRSAGMSRSHDHSCLSVVAAVLQFVNRTIGSLLSPSRRCHIPTVFCSTVAVIESKNWTETTACMAGHMQMFCKYWELDWRRYIMELTKEWTDVYTANCSTGLLSLKWVRWEVLMDWRVYGKLQHRAAVTEVSEMRSLNGLTCIRQIAAQSCCHWTERDENS
jgi:hypothetical protein